MLVTNMKKYLSLAILLLLFPLVAYSWAGVIFMSGRSPSATSGNDFSSDDNCVALWRFESGALITDSKGGNTLTDHGTVSESTVDYKEGACSADFISGNSEYFSITDTDLDAGFPFRAGDGTPNDDISLCFWIKPDVLGDNDYIFSKYDVGLNKRTFVAVIFSSEIQVNIGWNGGNDGATYLFGTNLSTGKWYHVGITFQNGSSDTSSLRIRIWDYDAGALLSADYTTSAAKTINIEDAVLCIADREGDADKLYDGHVDELVVFKDILSVDEIDKIRSGTYP